MSTREDSTGEIRERVAAVLDPELPMLTIADLGILRDVAIGTEDPDNPDGPDGTVVVTITPTYAGCPAMETIAADIRASLPERDVQVRTVLSPAWSTDWMSEVGRAKLAEHGIAPPGPRPGSTTVDLRLSVRCPQCGSRDTRELSRFGSTACKSLWVCEKCQEPFDRFKDLL